MSSTALGRDLAQLGDNLVAGLMLLGVWIFLIVGAGRLPIRPLFRSIARLIVVLGGLLFALYACAKDIDGMKARRSEGGGAQMTAFLRDAPSRSRDGRHACRARATLS